ncbi:MAG: PAS domain S-box protein [Alphaproteobacteria bacterium]|nr:PAS domain S-box protein [Alphaproteobacteria bacterium]
MDGGSVASDSTRESGADAGLHRRIFDAAAVAIAQTSIEGRIMMVNPAFTRLTGFPADELVGSDFRDLTHPDDLTSNLALFDDLIEGRSEIFLMEKRYRRKSGGYVWVAIEASIVRDAHGRPDFIVGAAVSIEDRKRAEEALAAREAQLRTIFDAVPVGLILAELPSGRIIEGNKHVEHMLRHPILHSPDIHSYGEWVGYHADGRRVESHEYPLARMALAGEEEPSLDVNYRRGDGSFFWGRVSGRPVRDAAGTVVGGVVALLDIDAERRAREEVDRKLHRLQNQLIHGSRVSAMGAMASAMAHELNQPLAAIGNYLEVAGRAIDRGDTAGEAELLFAIEAASGCAIRAGDIIRRLRAMLVHGDARKEPALVAELIAEARALVSIGKGDADVDFRQEVSPALAVLGDPIQIQQVLLNLMRNAIESMEESAERCLCIRAAPSGDMVEIAVRDTGRGIDPAMREILFEPFNSTKEEGMGVGLSICRTIVEAHGGRIWAEPAPGGGSVFRLTLPSVGRG